MGRTAYLVDGLRTPFGRHGGALASMRADDLAAFVVRTLVARSGVPGESIDDVIMGCANQAGEDNRNVARMAALLAGLPVGVPGVTINRLCGSGMQAFGDAARLVLLDEADLVICGGVEQMSRAPWVMPKPEQPYPRGQVPLYDTTLGWRFVNPAMERAYGTLSMGHTAERVAHEFDVSREEQDEFALRSQTRAQDAVDHGRLAEPEVVPVQTGTQRKTGEAIVCSKDEHPRRDLTLAQLARLRPFFLSAEEGGTVTAGNASGINDGACALLVASERAVQEYQLEPLAIYRSAAVAGVEPNLMGIGPVPASRRALERAGYPVSDLACAELNEAFAAQAIPCIRELGLDPERVNPNGGAIALGHPLGASGARILLTLAYELRRRGGGVGLAAMCIGVGQGIATVIESCP